ncbi:class I SAM-dependent methyltransferase [Telmatospirillum siberiense]|uniref:SAM-dependent methyltransferase n=1 Tax=Telmatospirillum siberiense TaxID=382514 RepID=A0A2N3PQS3_9PROT|nr:class I SAM-dependent methyltransferase [Telmatospirillum siberiense]PKU22749.1 SAM-dependent methyltransferase [Telmatospirillum siberiense]
MPVHHSAQAGFAAQAATYERGRPDYPQAIQEWLTGHLGLGPNRSVIDLGAGTGKFTGRLAGTGATVSAVEPVAEMRRQFTKVLPDVPILEGNAEAIPFPDASLDAVVCAQAFHWFATKAAMVEITRVLKPGGALGLVWNARDVGVDWVAAVSDIITPYEGDAPRFAKGDWKRQFPADGLSPLDEQTFLHEHRGSPDRVIVDRILSVSFIGALEAPERDKVEARLRHLIATHPALANQPEIAFPYRTCAYRCVKLPTE